MSNVILIGFMGCGKSTVGIRLSYRLRRVVEDTDKLIEKKAGMSISEIFERDGEAAFRRLETECLRDMLGSKEERLISTGGGLPLREENRELLKRLGAVVYLKITPECVWERLEGDDTRPLLQCEEPLARIRELLGQRARYYEEAADITVEVDGKSMRQVVDEIVQRLKETGYIETEGDAADEDFGD